MKTTLKIGLAAVAMGMLGNLFFGGGGDKSADVHTLVENGALVVDVRTKHEFGAGHIEGAANIPYDAIANAIGQQAADKSKPIVVYCRSGSRSAHAKRALAKAGYTNVVDAGSFANMRRQLRKDGGE
jgi:phage shock protein E